MTMTLTRLDTLIARPFERAPFLFVWSLGHVFLAMGYWWAFTGDGFLRPAVIEPILYNILTSWLVGLGVAFALCRLLPGRGPGALLLLHLVAASVFSFGWYLTDITLLGWSDGSLATGARIEPFQGPAFVWQIFQGYAVYGALGALVHLLLLPARVPADLPQREVAAPSTTPGRMLLRTGDEMVTIDPGEIAAIVAADDYSEVRCNGRTHLVRRRLNEFEEELPPHFVRVHRSAIVNLDRVVRCEPAGSGRISVHLEGSEAVIASRAGARRLRERSL